MFTKVIPRLIAAVLVLGTASAEIDRHPELKSRTLAWTEFDGSYLVDTFSRAEMLNFYWTVFAKPSPVSDWNGTVTPPNAGTTSELWRVRQIAQLNAYRALNYSPAASEDPSKIPLMQEAAFIFVRNPDKELGHHITQDWDGYTWEVARKIGDSLLASNPDTTSPLLGPIDAFIEDRGDTNASWVGHRTWLLHDNSTVLTIGAAFDKKANSLMVALDTPYTQQTDTMDGYIAYPAPGFMPRKLVVRAPRWSFVPANDWTEFHAGSESQFYQFAPGVVPTDTTVSAKINGVEVPVKGLVRNYPPGPLTWEFDQAHLDPANIPDGTRVEITVRDVGEIYQVPGGYATIIGYKDYTYTVTIFDENIISNGAYSPKTPLVNLSTRGVIGQGEQQLIAGFVVAGDLPVRVALRTQGPGLAKFGLTDIARKTRVRVYDSNANVMGENAGWREHQDWRLLQSLRLNPDFDVEAGMVMTLWPGHYTAIVSDDTGANGIGVVEAFNIDSLTPTRLANLSTRGFVGRDASQLIAGIVVKDTARTFVIRTQGPGLGQLGIANPVKDTQLQIVRQSDGATLATNDDWKSDTRNARLSTDLWAYAPSDDHEAAIILKLEPGDYTALVSPKGAAGVGLIEVFDVGP